MGLYPGTVVAIHASDLSHGIRSPFEAVTYASARRTSPPNETLAPDRIASYSASARISSFARFFLGHVSTVSHEIFLNINNDVAQPPSKGNLPSGLQRPCSKANIRPPPDASIALEWPPDRKHPGRPMPDQSAKIRAPIRMSKTLAPNQINAEANYGTMTAAPS